MGEQFTPLKKFRAVTIAKIAPTLNFFKARKAPPQLLESCRSKAGFVKTPQSVIASLVLARRGDP
ncbi:hypothetical protein [Helicobacter zhangjianzhongii]|uniref:Uncharacterized protein n=1 Tax=Helicobacter zhangjianzhongii TaxID=2974574 RepID=A0ACC6FTY2_9HELI|nr:MULTISPECIES: hypothetical protein [unclassified Helicobacter]MDL0080754.1 hypothetical protein [Helicobacter sp. CPD2-1]MDL0082721.1 hypothetical protein [Helicobacter sp. XJK30-2]